MKKILVLLIILILTFSFSGCALTELLNDEKNVIDLSNGESYVKYNLVSNNNEYRPVESAYFEFLKDTFKYYENGVLKKEGNCRITYFGIENTISPLHLNFDFGKDENGFSLYDYVDCYTEDEKDNLNQFTILSEGYHVKTVRNGGVPIRDYHLSQMPYAFGTYVKESCRQYEYTNKKANYLNSAYLDGTFCDEGGNKLYFANNSYSSDPQSYSYDVYMRYENKANNAVLEGTISLSYYDESKDIRHYLALIYVNHGQNEPGEEKGTYAEADYKLVDFIVSENSISFVSGEYFYGNNECSFNPNNFIGGTYLKVK